MFSLHMAPALQLQQMPSVICFCDGSTAYWYAEKIDSVILSSYHDGIVNTAGLSTCCKGSKIREGQSHLVYVRADPCAPPRSW